MRNEIASMYRKHARSLRALAAETNDRTRRETILELAEAYDGIAAQYRDMLKGIRVRHGKKVSIKNDRPARAGIDRLHNL